MLQSNTIDKKYGQFIPIAITSVRVVLAIGFPFMPPFFQWIFVIIALISELLDDFFEYTFKWASPIEKILDPIADKIFFFSVGFTWLFSRSITWLQFFLLSAREIAFVIVIIYMAKRDRIHVLRPIESRFWGKLTTALQYVTFFIVLQESEPVPFVLALTASAGILAALQYMTVQWNPQWKDY